MATWSEKAEFVEIEPKSQPKLADQPAALSESIQPFPSQALGRRLALIIRHQSSRMRVSRLHSEGHGVVCYECVEISTPAMILSCLSLSERTRTFFFFPRYDRDHVAIGAKSHRPGLPVPGCLVGSGLMPEAKTAVRIVSCSPRSTWLGR